MQDLNPAFDLSVLVLRVALGVVFLAHGVNHVFRGGKIAGTARWFESLGMKPGVLHAWLASLTELASGALLLVGFLTPLAGAGVVGTMVVAWITNHLKNGYFIFRPGEGYEYVLFITFAALAMAALGGGGWSIDRVLVDHDVAGCNWLYGWHGLVVAGVAGGGGAALLLATCWRPNR
jgi:putative oxidoreductase